MQDLYQWANKAYLTVRGQRGETAERITQTYNHIVLLCAGSEDEIIHALKRNTRPQSNQPAYVIAIYKAALKKVEDITCEQQ